MSERPEAGLVIALGAFVAALGVVFALDALQWSPAGDWPGYSHAGAGAHAGGAMLTRLVGGIVLLLVGACVALCAALRGVRLK